MPTEAPEPRESADDPTQETLLALERRRAVRDAMSTLPERQRQIVETLFFSADPSYANLASRLAVPIGSIGPTRERALARFRRDLKFAAVAEELPQGGRRDRWCRPVQEYGGAA
jgi:DNA-directed RNA polymerase specialized sigma24 family protein